MLWTQLNKTMWQADYAGWTVTKSLQFTDRYGKDHFEYVATKDFVKHSNCSWEYVKSRILQTTQTNLF